MDGFILFYVSLDLYLSNHVSVEKLVGNETSRRLGCPSSWFFVVVYLFIFETGPIYVAM